MSNPQGLAERIIPARSAAKKATASFAEQLTDSPGRSDVDSPTSSNPFREPTHRTKSVKYRYTATGKHLSSPLKGSSSSPERRPAKPSRPKLLTFTPAPSHADKGKAPAVATTSRKRKASAVPVRKEDLLASSFWSTPSPLSSAPTTPIVSTKELSPSSSLPVKESVPNPPRRLQASKTLSLHALGSTTSKLSVLSESLSSKRKQKNKTSAKKDHAPWDIGNSVWVLVNESGVLSDNNAQLQNKLEFSQPLMWWPAQVVQNRPLRVSMFGDFPSSSSTSKGLCTIFSPSPSNIQSINDDSGVKRFSRATFSVTSPLASGSSSPPTKKARLDESASVEAKWESAVQSMDKASTLEKDGLPALLSSYATTGGSFYDSLDDSDPDTADLRRAMRQPASPARKRPKVMGSTKKLKAQRSRTNLKENLSGTSLRDSSPCPPDPTLQIPGELILAMAPRTGGFYWPAQVLEHVPDRKEKYKVKFLDDEEHVITRDRFWTSEEEGFVQCTLGEWESAVKTTDDLESGDEDEEYGADDDVSVEDPDDTSALLSPPPAEEFEDLSVRKQLAYVKPVLRAILKNEYGPAREKHEAFMKGGSPRIALLKSAGVRGGMDARIVKAVQKAICEWVLGDSGMKLGTVTTETGAVESGAGKLEGGAPAEEISANAVTVATLLTTDATMEGIEVTIAAAHASDRKDRTKDAASPSFAPDTYIEAPQDSQMAVDRQEQQPLFLPPTNGTALSPAIKQAPLAPKSQLDLLAEVSQAVATEPSLLPSHPEIPKLKVDLLDVTCKDMSPQPSPLTPVADEDQPVSSRSGPDACEEFETLSGVERLDYCLNILLPETIQQLVLWRSGERTSAVLLSPEEEQRMHDAGARKAAETDWVDDVMRLRAAQARLRGVDTSKKVEGTQADAIPGGTRSRPRRGTVSRP